MKLIEISNNLSRKVERLQFEPPVHYCYNPLKYAAKPQREYLERYGSGKKMALLLGMNPGPFGMAQTGVPFGDVVMVRDWMGIEEKVLTPKSTHPKRPIQGFDCPRREVSGTRLWTWASERFGTPKKFFKQFFVWNYCPLAFLEESGRNYTPDKLPAAEKKALFEACDQALAQVIAALEPEYVVGIGKFAEARIKNVVGDGSVTVGSMLHPSPASPKANKGWARAAENDLRAIGIELP